MCACIWHPSYLPQVPPAEHRVAARLIKHPSASAGTLWIIHRSGEAAGDGTTAQQGRGHSGKHATAACLGIAAAHTSAPRATAATCHWLPQHSCLLKLLTSRTPLGRTAPAPAARGGTRGTGCPRCMSRRHPAWQQLWWDDDLEGTGSVAAATSQESRLLASSNANRRHATVMQAQQQQTRPVPLLATHYRWYRPGSRGNSGLPSWPWKL